MNAPMPRLPKPIPPVPAEATVGSEIFRVHQLADTEVTFVLTSGGHNAGIVSEPGHPRRHYRIATRKADGFCLDPDEWAEAAAAKQGSWWGEWTAWIDAHSGKERLAPPGMGATGRFVPVADAPGAYVLQR